MRLKFFTVPVFDPEGVEKEINAFLAAHQVLKVDRFPVSDSSGSCWSVCVSYQAGREKASTAKSKSKVDYREILAPEEFEVFAEMRRWRKDLAASEGVPPYQVFNNEQLAGLIQQRMRTVEAVAGLPGIGTAKVTKYGQAVLDRFGAELASLGPARKGADAARGDSP